MGEECRGTRPALAFGPGFYTLAQHGTFLVLTKSTRLVAIIELSDTEPDGLTLHAKNEATSSEVPGGAQPFNGLSNAPRELGSSNCSSRSWASPCVADDGFAISA